MERATFAPVEPETARHRGVARHRAGTPGLRSYRNMVIDLDATGRRIGWRRARHLRRRFRRMAGSQWAMALATLTTASLLLIAGWQTTEGLIALSAILAP